VSKLRVLIADDEPLARDRLRSLLKTEPTVELIGECGNGPDAIAAIRNAAPDLVFLDIEMPGATGLDVMQAIPAAKRPAIIFATAHDRFAVDAFDLQAVDYLLKPFDKERFQTALKRAHEHIRTRAAAASATNGTPANGGAGAPAAENGEKKSDRLAVKADGRLVLLKPDDIVWVEAADNYVVLHLKEGRLMLRETLTAIEERLGPASFTRVNRSALVHLDQIRELQPTFHGDYVVILRDGSTKIPLSRSLRGQLEKFVGERLG